MDRSRADEVLREWARVARSARRPFSAPKLQVTGTALQNRKERGVVDDSLLETRQNAVLFHTKIEMRMGLAVIMQHKRRSDRCSLASHPPTVARTFGASPSVPMPGGEHGHE